MKSIDNSPDRAKQANERSHRARDREPRHVALKPRNLFRAGDLHGALNRQAASLPAVFGEASFEYRNQWTRFELFGHSRYILQPLRFPKRSHKASALHPRSPHQTPLGKNDGPRDYAKDQQE